VSSRTFGDVFIIATTAVDAWARTGSTNIRRRRKRGRSAAPASPGISPISSSPLGYGRHGVAPRSRARRNHPRRRRGDAPFSHGLGETPLRAPRLNASSASDRGRDASQPARDGSIKALFWSAVFNGVAAVAAGSFAVVTIASNRKADGALGRVRCSRAFWGWLTFALMGLAATRLCSFSGTDQ